MFSLLLIALLQLQPIQMLREDPDRAGVNTHPYEFREVQTTPAPKGYKPVYISHYGRHGSRVNWERSNYTYVIDILENADDAGILTQEGKELLQEAQTVSQVHRGADGHLTRLGEKEHRMLAERMYENYPEVFRKGSGLVRVESSTVHRCLVSMANFVGELIRLQPGLQFEIDSDNVTMSYIGNGASEEHNRASELMLEPLRHVQTDTVSILGKLFTDPAAARKIVGSVDKFQTKIWEVARIARSSGVKANVYRHLPEDVIYKWWDYSNRELYIRHGNSPEFGKGRMKNSEPLVNVLVTKADEVLASGHYAADLIFGHDCPLISLAGYFHLSGVGESVSFDEIPMKWNDPMNIPFAANLQMIFYKSRRSPDVLVKFVYGDVERTIAELDAVSGVYYKWEDVKKFIDKRKAE